MSLHHQSHFDRSASQAFYSSNGKRIRTLTITEKQESRVARELAFDSPKPDDLKMRDTSDQFYQKQTPHWQNTKENASNYASAF